ncbi:MAG TPA: hypothetical protein PKY36_08305, partial [Opitutaceae bacterium]|nr:hypothetical protein [Opitutaceae bacterium]
GEWDWLRRVEGQSAPAKGLRADGLRAKGPYHTSLGQRPWNPANIFHPSANGAVHRVGAKSMVDGSSS